MKSVRVAVRLLAVAIALFACQSVNAQTCPVSDPQTRTVSWDPPTEYEDGSPLGTDLDGYFLYSGKTASGTYELPAIDITASTDTSRVLSCLEPHTTYYVVMTSYVPCNLQPEADECKNGATRVESRHSAELTFTTGGSTVLPNAPDNLSVDPSNLTAYSVEETRNFIALVPVGTVAAGTPCLGNVQVNGKFGVPIDEVDYAGTVRPQVVVASCVP